MLSAIRRCLEAFRDTLKHRVMERKDKVPQALKPLWIMVGMH